MKARKNYPETITHLDDREREIIKDLHSKGHSATLIAKYLKRSKTTIAAEIARQNSEQDLFEMCSIRDKMYDGIFGILSKEAGLRKYSDEPPKIPDDLKRVIVSSFDETINGPSEIVEKRDVKNDNSEILQLKQELSELVGAVATEVSGIKDRLSTIEAENAKLEIMQMQIDTITDILNQIHEGK